ncbi:nicotinate phosphoribosyltransferase [Acidilobus sp.]|jgi:nicotinate phosphoribosyltransferase|uniref:nicotinate phosphoribosyltransferase n=1 Tax=Acidilobus sp. TaxID=1872109 RepID=UPI003CFBC540
MRGRSVVPREPSIFVATKEEITNGEASDIYFKRTQEVLRFANLSNVKVRMEVHLYSNPPEGDWAVYAGLEEALAILKDKPFTVYSVPEGTVFRRKTPLMLIEAPYEAFAPFEAPVLGVLRFESSIATKSARIRVAAGDKLYLFFGLRALHPAVFPAADRAAFIGGADSVSGILSEKYLGLTPQGTMPHALIITVGDQKKAWQLFAELYGNKINIVALADTFDDERIEALTAAELLKEKLWGIRLDTPSSRRGNMHDIVEEVKWTLKLHGYDNVKVIVSGGLDEQEIAELRDVADGFGVGTSVAMPKSVDLSMDIVEVDRGNGWEPISKRGKMPGAKMVYSCGALKHHVVPWSAEPPTCDDGRRATPLLVKYLDNGKLVRDLPSLGEIRSYVISQLKELKLLQ